MEEPARSAEEDEQMLLLCHASLWHWAQRQDCTPRNLSIGYWQISRVSALLGQPGNAIRYADLCLHYSRNEAPFYVGYAYEALARGAMLKGDSESAAEYLRQARTCAAEISDAEARAALEKDLDSI